MKHFVGIVALSLMLLTGLAGHPAFAAQELSPDAQGIEQLVRKGADLDKLHRFEFTLRFPSQKAAQNAELQLIGLAFAIRSEPGKTGGEWSVLATKKMYPVESDLAGLRDKLNAVAVAGHGVYVGWKATPATGAN